MKYDLMATAGSTGQAPPDAPMPTRLIDSTPPPTVIVVLPRHDLRGGEVDRVEAGRTEPVDLYARHMGAVVGGERGGARDAAARLPDRIDATQHHIVQLPRVEMGAFAQSAQRGRGEAERRHLVQRAVALAATARGAHVIKDEGVGHRRS